MKGSRGQIVSLHIGKSVHFEAAGSGEWWDKPWETGFYKEPRVAACWLGYEGFRGDEQADRRHHGGPEKAVCVYPEEHYLFWRGELTELPLPHGAFGENLTVSGLLESDVCIGDRFSVGDAVVQISQPRQPCWKLARRWRVKDLSARVEHTGFSGYYFRVKHHGMISVGDTLTLLERPFPEWTIERCNQIMHHHKSDSRSAIALAGCPDLSASWKDALWLRGNKDESTSRAARMNFPPP
jgi:MOSC domain-containing protein YiiM